MRHESINHYHGTPIWGNAGEVHRIAVQGAGAFVSFVRTDQAPACFRRAAAVAIDNGAFSAWKQGVTIDWQKFYRYVSRYYEHDRLAFFVIPDVVEGGEADNDRLIDELPGELRDRAVPVWHLHESIDRLIHLCESWPRVCFGSSGQFAVIRTKAWHARMVEAFGAIYIDRQLTTRIHGLRMLDSRVLGSYPLHSADSTNLACNVPKYKTKYPQLTKAVLEAGYGQEQVLNHRCAILKGAIESVKPPGVNAWVHNYREIYHKMIEGFI